MVRSKSEYALYMHIYMYYLYVSRKRFFKGTGERTRDTYSDATVIDGKTPILWGVSRGDFFSSLLNLTGLFSDYIDGAQSPGTTDDRQRTHRLRTPRAQVPARGQGGPPRACPHMGERLFLLHPPFARREREWESLETWIAGAEGLRKSNIRSLAPGSTLSPFGGSWTPAIAMPPAHGRRGRTGTFPPPCGDFDAERVHGCSQTLRTHREGSRSTFLKIFP